MGFGYAMYTTWNAIVEDDSTPLGWRIRAKEADLGPGRAKALLDGTAWTLGAMRNFGRQSEMWGLDLMRLLKKAGIRIDYSPPVIRHLGGQDMLKS